MSAPADAVDYDGAVVGWGDNYYGQAPGLTLPPAGTKFVQVAAGMWHSLGLTDVGTVVGWGHNGYGQAPGLTSPPAGTKFVQVATDEAHSLGLTDAGTVVGWGHNGFGQAPGLTSPPAGTKFVQIATDERHSLGLIAPADADAPSTSHMVSPEPNAAGWTNADVTVTLSATDDPGGSGVRATYYTVDNGPQQTYLATFSVTTEGQHAISYWSVDNSGNAEALKTLNVNLDKTAPVVSCDSPDGQWHANDVSIPCTANDALSGRTNEADASFSLSTSVAPDTEDADSATDIRTVTDVAGNSATAGPIDGNMVDKKAPTITVTAPTDGAGYLFGHPETGAYAAADGGSGIKTVEGTVASGSSLPGDVGWHDFKVTATDNVGNTSTKTVQYQVTYEWSDALSPIKPDGSSVFRLGSTVPIKLQLNGASADVSNAVIRLYVTKVNIDVEGTTVEAGSTSAADTGNVMRYDPAVPQYVYNLSSKDAALTVGTYRLKFYVGGDHITGVLLGQVDFSLK